MCLIANKRIFIFQARLAWAQQICNIITSLTGEEITGPTSVVTSYKSDGRVRVWRRRGERFHPECIQPRVAFGGGSVMVWGMVSLNCKSNLVTVNGNLNARRFRDEILAEQVEPHFDDHALAIVPSWCMMGQRHILPGFRWLSCASQSWKCFLGLPSAPTKIQLSMCGITSDDIWTKWTRVYNHWTSWEKRSMCGVICHSSMSDVWFTVCGEEW